MSKIEIFIVLRRIAYGTEFISAAIGLFFLFRKQFKGILKWFPIFLTYIFLNDTIGLNIRHLFPNNNNLILYNISTSLTFIFVFFIYHWHAKERKTKAGIKYATIVYILAFIISSFFENYLTQLQSRAFIVGAFLVMTTIVVYYSESLKMETVYHTSKELLFWISTGFLIYYIGKIPFRIVRDYYANHDNRSVLFILNIVLTLVMNICFILGFIVHKKEK